MGKHVIGWKLGPAQRRALLARFPPHYPDVVADHVTLAAKVAADAPLPAPATAEIVGRADDDAGVEALVASVDGTSIRPGGGRYHITWSLDKARGREPRQSNDVIADRGWEPLESPFILDLRPARWP